MTDKISLSTVEEFMTGYTPVYKALYPLFLARSQAYSEIVGTVDFKRVDTVGDIRAKHITPKDTEMRQIAVGESKKTFKKYFLANQFIQSTLQDQSGIDEVVAKVLEEHQKQADELLLFGDGTSAGTVINNGLYWSSDANYVLKSSVEVDTTNDPLLDLYAKVISTYREADQLSGQKAIIFYGDTVLAKASSLFAAQPVSFKATLQAALPGVTLIDMPSEVTPVGAAGWIVVNLDQVRLSYSSLPQLKAQGVNEEKMYTWHNFLMGSMMLEVNSSKGIIRQPATFEA